MSPTESTPFQLLHLLLFRIHTIWKFHPRRIFNFSALYYLMSNSLPYSLSCYWSFFYSYDTYLLFLGPLFLYLFVLSCILFRVIDLFSTVTTLFLCFSALYFSVSLVLYLIIFRAIDLFSIITMFILCFSGKTSVMGWYFSSRRGQSTCCGWHHPKRTSRVRSARFLLQETEHSDLF